MRELIIKCDHCGKVIEGNPYKVRLEQEDRDTEEFITNLTEEQQKVGDMDWCENCFRNLTAFLLDTSHKLLAAPNVIREEKKVVKEPETVIKEPVPDPEISDGGAPKKKVKIDIGKLKALYDAGWKAKDIAIEFGVSEQAIYLRLKQLREEKDACD